MEKIMIRVDRDIEDLIPGFLENRKKDLVAMKEVLDAGDFETIRMIGHSMKGFGAGYGFQFITEIGKEIELAAKSKQRDEILAHLDSIKEYLNKIEICYE